MPKPPGELEVMGRQLFIGLRSVVQRAVAKGVASIADDVRDVVDTGSGRLGKFVAGCEEIARQGKSEPPPVEPPEVVVDTTRQTPRAKKKGKRRARS